MTSTCVTAAAQRPFSSPVSLRANPTADTGGDELMAVAPGATPGVWVAFWAGNIVGSGGTVYRSRSTDDGRTWSAPAAVVAGTNLGCQIASDTSGTIVCVWHQYPSPNAIFVRSADSGQTWTSPATVSSGTVAQYWPRIGTDNNGRFIVVWQNHGHAPSGSDYDPYFSISTNSGQTWSAAAILQAGFAADTGSLTGTNDQPGNPVADGNGNWIIPITSQFGGTMTANSPFYLCYSRSTNNGASWSALGQMTNAPIAVVSTQPVAATDRIGNWVATASGISATSDFDLFAARSSNNGISWSSTVINTLGSSDGVARDDQPVVRTDGLGRWVTTWSSQNSLGGTIGSDADILLAESFDLGQNWSAPRVLTQTMASDAANAPERNCDLRVDSRRHWLAAFDIQVPAGSDYDPHVAYGLPNVTLAPTQISFGERDIDAGAAGAGAVVGNAGFGTLNFVDPQFNVSGTDASHFSATSSTVLSSLAPNTTVGLQVGFDPTSVGAKSATISVYTDDPTSPVISASMDGIGTDQEVVITPTTPIAFTTWGINDGPTASKTVTVTNTGTAVLAFPGGISINGANSSEFQIIGTPPTSLGPGQSYQVEIVFNPTTAGSKSATLNIPTDDSDEPANSISLSGNAVAFNAAEDWQLLE